MQATARPWVSSKKGEYHHIIYGSDQTHLPLIADCHSGDVDAAHIVHCVNTHEAVMNGLELALGYLGVAKLSNEAGAHIKIDQAISALKSTLTLAKGGNVS